MSNSLSSRPSFKKPLHILVVDDNSLNLLVAQKMLQSFGAQVTLAENGEDAIHVCKTKDVDIILMDIQMPVLDGYGATIQLRKLNYTKPIVALSADSYTEQVKQSLDSGMNAHLQKPFQAMQLFEMINRFVA